MNVPANQANGFPLTMSTGQHVTGVDLVLRYDPALLTVTGFTINQALTDAGVELNTATPGTAILTIARTTAFANATSPSSWVS